MLHIMCDVNPSINISRACAPRGHILKVRTGRRNCWPCASAPNRRSYSASYRRGVSQWELGHRPALMHGMSWPVAERPVARHPSGITIPDPKMCRDHDPGTQKTAGIHWDPTQNRHDPRIPMHGCISAYSSRISVSKAAVSTV